MTTAVPALDPDIRARRNLRVLVAAQVILGSQMQVSFILGGLAGQMLSPVKCLATLPISLIVFGSMFAAPVLSNLMQRRGRTAGFLVGAAGGALGGALCAWALIIGSFLLFLVARLRWAGERIRRIVCAVPPPSVAARDSSD
jgi:hypothetical protein